jgi:anti-sigma regulatory factor (Ser/Thr protein kinase)
MQRELRQPNIAVTMNLVEVYPRRIQLANAGMPPPLLFRRGQAQPQQLQAAGVYVGGGYSRFPVEPRSVETGVNEGDLLILISDGVLEARSHNSSIFGRPGIEAAVARARDSEPEVIAKEILSAAAEYSGNQRPTDDQTVVVVRFGGRNPAPAGAETLVVVGSDESEVEFTLINAADSAPVCDSILQPKVRGWVESSGGYSAGKIWCAIWEALKNAVLHGSNRGEVISLKLRRIRDEIVVEVEQPAEWRNWDKFLGEAKKKRLSEGAPQEADELIGTVALLRLADTVTASMLGRRLTLVFKRGNTPSVGA